jgi:hypothetical protein
VISVAILHASEQTDAGSGALNGRCGITLRAVLLSVLLILVFNVLVSRVELVTGRYIASGIPPIPAVATLAALVALYPLGRLILGRYNLRRQELLVIYCLMTIAIPLCGTYGLRSILPRLTVMQYYATAENRFADYSHLMPSWYAPDGEQAITSMYEGLDGGAIPWSEWRKPLVLWSLFFLALFVGTMSLMSVMSRQWAEGEHLPYPLVQLPIEMVEATDARGTLANFFTNPLTWTCMRHGIALCTWGPLASGILSGIYRRQQPIPAGHRWSNADPEINRRFTTEALDLVEKLIPLAEAKGIDLAALSHAWLQQRPGITCPIVGPRTVTHLHEALKTTEICFSHEELGAIDEAIPPGTWVSDFYFGNTYEHMLRSINHPENPTGYH